MTSAAGGRRKIAAGRHARSSPLRNLYTALYILALCALLPRTLWHLLTGGRYAIGLRERLGAVPSHLEGVGTGGVWIHAVSVGEVHAARGLIPHLRAELPDAPVLLSTTTPTGQALARNAGADAHFYMPLDLPGALAPYLDRLRPRAVILVETEIWPNLMHEAVRRQVPVALVNGRLSDRSGRGYARLTAVWPDLVTPLRIVCARSEEEARRFVDLGIPQEHVYWTGNLKGDAAALRPPEALRKELSRTLDVDRSDTLLVAGCTMPDEEEQVLRAFGRARESYPEARLLLAPRHPERFDRVEQTITDHGFGCRRRSAAATDRDDAAVLLLDSIGELPAAYGLGVASFVGGSLVPTGGHNLLEPAVHGQPILFGPHVDNFQALADEMLRSGGGRRVLDAAELAAAWLELLGSPELRRRMGARARAVALRDATAGRRTARILRRALWPAA